MQVEEDPNEEDAGDDDYDEEDGGRQNRDDYWNFIPFNANNSEIHSRFNHSSYL